MKLLFVGATFILSISSFAMMDKINTIAGTYEGITPVYENGTSEVEGYSPFSFGEAIEPATKLLHYKKCSVKIETKHGVKVSVNSVIRNVRSVRDRKHILDFNNPKKTMSLSFSKKAIKSACNAVESGCYSGIGLNVTYEPEYISIERRTSGALGLSDRYRSMRFDIKKMRITLSDTVPAPKAKVSVCERLKKVK